VSSVPILCTDGSGSDSFHVTQTAVLRHRRETVELTLVGKSCSELIDSPADS